MACSRPITDRQRGHDSGWPGAREPGQPHVRASKGVCQNCCYTGPSGQSGPRQPDSDGQRPLLPAGKRFGLLGRAPPPLSVRARSRALLKLRTRMAPPPPESTLQAVAVHCGHAHSLRLRLSLALQFLRPSPRDTEAHRLMGQLLEPWTCRKRPASYICSESERHVGPLHRIWLWTE